ncbi:MAG TPA: pantoate--beta-alanine ligase [Candidatus Dormibacteraeota bacterium]|nr:pantoate--beta-alanine ligase [Candidatus Dormibacteraeota bacterium]
MTQPRALREAVAKLPRPLGFVPTMGSLHAGHLALLARARAASACVAASVFVNPLQFRAGEDFERYPRDLAGDRSALEGAGVELLFAPDADAMYPTGFSTAIDPGSVGEAFEGAIRPDHFRGVATVVVKLLDLVTPDVLYVGQKDAQQTAVLRRVVRDLNVPVEIEIVETVRESDGLALSSRNAYLSGQERTAAPTLYRSLRELLAVLERGASKAEAIAVARSALAPAASLDYYDLVDADTFEPLERLRPPAFVLGAARFGSTRLIDNLWVRG